MRAFRRSTRPASSAPSAALAVPLALVALLGVGAQGVAAQHPKERGLRLERDASGAVQTTEPMSGGPGTLVRYRAPRLPANTEVQVMMGGMGAGFEVVLTGTTDAEGHLGEDSLPGFIVPKWVKPDRSYLVMVSRPSYELLGPAEAFQPTDADGVAERRGEVQAAGRCMVLTDDTRLRYALTGNTSGIGDGDHVVVEGTLEPAGGGCQADVGLAVRAHHAP